MKKIMKIKCRLVYYIKKIKNIQSNFAYYNKETLNKYQTLSNIINQTQKISLILIWSKLKIITFWAKT